MVDRAETQQLRVLGASRMIPSMTGVSLRVCTASDGSLQVTCWLMSAWEAVDDETKGVPLIAMRSRSETALMAPDTLHHCAPCRCLVEAQYPLAIHVLPAASSDSPTISHAVARRPLHSLSQKGH